MADKICPILTVGASMNANPQMKAQGILIVYATCTPNCMLFVPNKVQLPGQPAGTCGLSREPGTSLIRGSLN